jgi:hypothetical protein
MKNEFRELEIGNQIMDLIHAYDVPLQNFVLELIFAVPNYNRVRVTLEFFPEKLISDEFGSQGIDFIAMARDLSKIIQSFGSPTDMFGLTVFVNSRDFDVLAQRNPAIAEEDILGRIEKEDSQMIWYIQIIRLHDAIRSSPKPT